ELAVRANSDDGGTERRGDRFRMQQRAEQLDAVDEAWAGTAEVRVGVDRHDSRAEIRDRVRLLFCAARVPAAGHHDDDVRPRGAHLVPPQLARARAGLAEDVRTARQRDLLRNPVAAVEWRVDPFDTGDARPRSPHDGLAHRIYAFSQRGDEPLRLSRATERV